MPKTWTFREDEGGTTTISYDVDANSVYRSTGPDRPCKPCSASCTAPTNPGGPPCPKHRAVQHRPPCIRRAGTLSEQRIIQTC